jgi:hypothetical protein
MEMSKLLLLPPDFFPIEIEAFREDTKEVVWTTLVERPKEDEASQIHVPPLKKIHGVPIGIRISYANGIKHEVTSEENDSEEQIRD